MNITLVDGVATMTSLELVEFINGERAAGEAELRHDDFMRKVPKVFGEDARKFSDIYLDSMNRRQNGYRFPKREACLMAMSYSYDLQAKVYDRMTQLEQGADPRIPKSYVGALRLAADEAEKRAEAEARLAIAAPKAEALDRISASDDAVTMTEAAKVLGIKRSKLTDFMHAQGWIYRQNGSWLAYDQHIKNGRLQYKEAHYTDEKTLQKCIKPYCHIFPKGLAKLAEMLGLEVVA